MSPETNLHNVYLISGGYDAENRRVVERSAVPIRHGFFTRLNHKEHTLIATDEYGMLCSLGSSGKKLQRINDQNLGPLALNPIPPGIARQSYFAFDKEWQTTLIEEIRALNMTTSLTPIPVTFTDKHLRAGQDADEEKMLQHFTGRTCQGQLIPRFHVLVVLVDHAILAHAPGKLTAHREGTAVTLHRAPRPVGLSIGPAVKTKSEFWVYSASGLDVKEGSYVARLPSDHVPDPWKRRDHADGTIDRTFQVTFGVHTYFGDFDFQVLDLPSVEDAILTHFAERYSHLLIDDSPADKTADAPYAQASGSLARYRPVAALLSEKTKIIAGYVNANASARAKTIIGASLGALRDSNTKGVSDAAEIANGIVSKWYSSKETLEAWEKLAKKMNIMSDHAAELGLVKQVMDGNAISKFFAQNKWRDVAIDAIEKKRDKLGRRLFFHKAHSDPALIKTLMANAVSPPLSAYEKAMAERAVAKAGRAVLWAVDTFVSVKQIVDTAYELHELHATEEVAADRLRKNMAEYAKRFRSAPCTEAIARLEVLRKAADAASMGMDEKTFEAIETAAKLTLRALTSVPVVGEFAGLATLVIESLEVLGNIVDLASDTVDRFVWRHRSTVSRFRELSRLHALQCRAIAKAEGSKHDDPHTQFRLRLIVLIGLLRLIERCGSPHGDENARQKFNRKVEQYQIQGYINHYVFPTQPFQLALSSGTPLDEIWVYACGNKETSWNDLAAQMDSVKDGIVELVRGTRSVFAPLAFQRYFPIHGMGSSDTKELASSFSVNFSEVMDKNLVYSRVYVRKDKKDRWIPVDEATFTIEPGTAVRVAAIFKSEADLTGIPMSLQIKRVDPLITVDGPVYKSSLGRVTKSFSDDIDDKGLLDYTDEGQYLKDKNLYSCVFYPFYFFKHHMINGVKPFGFIGLSGDITLDFSFDLKAGDDGKWVSTGKGRTLRMHLSTSNPLHVEMILNREFLNHKAPEPHYENMFNFPWQKFQAGAVFMKFGATPDKGQDWKPAALNGKTFEFDRPPTFEWGKAAELLVIFGAPFASQQRWQGDPIRLPARIFMKQPKWWGMKENKGPSFPVEVFSIKRDQKFKTITQADFLPALRQANLLNNADHWLPCSKITFDEESTVWAVRIAFKFFVEGKDGKMAEQSGLRPFGEKFIPRESSESYTYTFDLRSPEVIGLDLRDFLKLTVRGVPQDFLANTALAGDTSWVTNEVLWPLTEIEKLKTGKPHE